MCTEISNSRRNTLDELYRAFEVVADGAYLYVCDLKHDYSRWSEEAVQYFGLPDAYMLHAGQIWEEHIHPDDQQSYHESIVAVFSGEAKNHDMQYRARDRQGRYVVCTCRGTVLRDVDGEPDYFAGTIRNHGLVNGLDALTGLQNQFGLFEYLNVLYSKQSKANIMMIGIKHFSAVNEMYGYDFGNLVIHKVVSLLKETFRNEGILYRGDGICFVLLTFTLSIEELKERYARLHDIIGKHLEIDGYHPNMLVCGSALEVRNFDVKPQAMFSCLRYAYNLSRERPSNELWIFKTELDEQRNNLMLLINQVRKSIERGCEGFLLYYQPIIDARTNRIMGAEALLRWQRPEYGVVPPGQFIPIIENDPAFVQLGEWVLRRALEETRPILKTDPHFELNVNIAYEQLRQNSFVDMVKRNLEITGFPPGNLYLEITERCRLLDLKRLSGILSALGEIGVHFAIDDFGTGYSSVDILNQLEFDVVKIDRAFIANINKEEKAARLIGIMSELADACGSRVCAEGVETQGQCEVVKSCGVDSIQGYYYSRPIPLQEFLARYEEMPAPQDVTA